MLVPSAYMIFFAQAGFWFTILVIVFVSFLPILATPNILYVSSFCRYGVPTIFVGEYDIKGAGMAYVLRKLLRSLRKLPVTNNWTISGTNELDDRWPNARYTWPTTWKTTSCSHTA